MFGVNWGGLSGGGFRVTFHFDVGGELSENLGSHLGVTWERTQWGRLNHFWRWLRGRTSGEQRQEEVMRDLGGGPGGRSQSVPCM